jgi:CBS domain containing-hemolysin-like protein
MEDVVETLLGLEIVDEADSVEDMQALARQQWFKRARELGMVSEEAYEKVSARAQEESADGSAIPNLPSKEELAEGEAIAPPPTDSPPPESASKNEE